MKIKKTNSVCRVPPASLSLDLTDTRACCCCCSNQLGIIIPWGLHEVLGGLRQHLLVVHTSFPPTTTFSRRRRRRHHRIRHPTHSGWWNTPHTLPQFWTFQIRMRKQKCKFKGMYQVSGHIFSVIVSYFTMIYFLFLYVYLVFKISNFMKTWRNSMVCH